MVRAWAPRTGLLLTILCAFGSSSGASRAADAQAQAESRAIAAGIRPSGDALPSLTDGAVVRLSRRDNTSYDGTLVLPATGREEFTFVLPETGRAWTVRLRDVHRLTFTGRTATLTPSWRVTPAMLDIYEVELATGDVKTVALYEGAAVDINRFDLDTREAGANMQTTFRSLEAIRWEEARPDQAPAVSDGAPRLPAFAPGTMVRVTRQDGVQYTGRLRATARDEFVFVRADGRGLRLRLGDLHRLTYLGGDHVVRPAWSLYAANWPWYEITLVDGRVVPCGIWIPAAVEVEHDGTVEADVLSRGVRAIEVLGAEGRPPA